MRSRRSGPRRRNSTRPRRLRPTRRQRSTPRSRAATKPRSRPRLAIWARMAAAAVTSLSAKRSPRNPARRFVAASILAMLAAISIAPADADDAAVARGAYLAAASGCDQCHTDSKNGGAPYAGGRVMETEFGAIATPNITPDPATGIGEWSQADFVRAMRWGIAPDGTHYVPAFPFPYFAGLTDADLADLWAYLRSLPPVPRTAIPGGASLGVVAR